AYLHSNLKGRGGGLRLPLGERTDATLTIAPATASGAGLWYFRIPVVQPETGAEITLQVPFAAVLGKEGSSLLSYDFGTSYSAVSTDYAGQRALLREPDADFIRSRAVVVWSEADWEKNEPTELLVGDRASIDKAGTLQGQCGFAVLDNIKTAFRRRE